VLVRPSRLQRPEHSRYARRAHTRGWRLYANKLRQLEAKAHGLAGTHQPRAARLVLFQRAPGFLWITLRKAMPTIQRCANSSEACRNEANWAGSSRSRGGRTQVSETKLKISSLKGHAAGK